MRQKFLLSRAKWYLPLVIGGLIALILLNVSISRSGWINSKIAAIQVTQISDPIMIDSELPDFDVEQRRIYLDLEMQKAQQHVAFEQQKYAQYLQALSAKNAASLKFRIDVYSAILSGLRFVSGSLGIGLIIGSILGGLGLNRYLTARAQANYESPPSEKTPEKAKHSTLPTGQCGQTLAKMIPAGDRRGTLADIRSTIPVWTRKTGDISPKRYPRAE